ncbi:pilin [Patescibacteria group bacterium]|nr:pilin [Patescibacteria group bacterium]MCL5010119.1 pilin [Patescibacteria group bacterium]
MIFLAKFISIYYDRGVKKTAYYIIFPILVLTVFLSPSSISLANEPCPNNICHTAIGNINVSSPDKFVTALFGVILSLSGGIAIILIIVSGYNLMFSQGNPEKVQGAKETLTSAIVGLLFIILSLVILQVIGVDILKIPGFGG